MKWSTVLVTASIGTRETSDQLTPSEDVLNTMSFEVHLARKRQSSHATYALPEASISAVGNGLVRRLPAAGWKAIWEMFASFVQLWPPSVERNAAIVPFRLSKGTITVPFGCTSGCPPIPCGWPAVPTGVDQVTPPSLDVLMYSRS